MDRWRHRRALIKLAVGLGVGMILFAAATYDRDALVSSQMVTGGVTLVTLVLTGYVFAATYDDTHPAPRPDDHGEGP